MKTLTLHNSYIAVCAKSVDVAALMPNDIEIIAAASKNSMAWCKKILPTATIIEIIDDEQHKNLASIDHIAEKLLRLGADRTAMLVAVGGGIVCDVAGFAASIYMRGMRCAFVPTTLLAQVDASIGGKNGVNFNGYKNILGAFRQPELVLCIQETLTTLPQDVFRAGFAEIIKAAVIADAELFDFIENNVDKLLHNEDILQHVIFESIKIKANIVAQDEKEFGIRRKLNLGHTFAHAIEKLSSVPHGYAVSIGVCLAARLAQSMSLLAKNSVDRIENLLQRLNLPTHSDIPMTAIAEIIAHDKKKQGSDIFIILPHAIGTSDAHKISMDELKNLLLNV
jgi:3-dehydroquinate synthase